MGQKKSVFLLLIPMLVVDLMSNWQYQYDINYQYPFGVAALLIYIALLAVKEMRTEKTVYRTAFVRLMRGYVFFPVFPPRMQNLISYNSTVQSTVQAYNELIATIPKDASITANGYYIPHMYNSKNLYMYPITMPLQRIKRNTCLSLPTT